MQMFNFFYIVSVFLQICVDIKLQKPERFWIPVTIDLRFFPKDEVFGKVPDYWKCLHMYYMGSKTEIRSESRSKGSKVP